MANKSSQPIVIKKIVQGGGHHGGSWKVAYADFVTAMMAFFLLMWLMGSTTKEQKAAISEYFNNPSPEEGISLKPSPNAVQGPGGSSTSLIDQGGIGVLSAEEKTVSDSAESPPDEDKKEVRDEQSAKEAAEKTFRERVEQMLEELKELTEKSETLRQYADQLLFDLTSEGLRIQIIDRENRPMFDVGSAALKPHTIEILREITKVINEINSPVSISGHTDARRLDRAGYSNWELSTERANAARRALVVSGIAEGKVARVVGLASSQLFNAGDPMDPTNRRVSITVLSPDSVSRNAEAPVAADTASTPPHAAAPAAVERPHGNGNGSRKPRP